MRPASTRSTRALLSDAPQSYQGPIYGVYPPGSQPSTDPAVPVESSAQSVRVHLVRALALLCACSLSVGSHYSTYFLGPLKTKLMREIGTSNTEFSLLLAAFSLNSTWTPLLGGFLASRLGTTVTSIIATSIIFLGQAILLLGDAVASVRIMTLGMFVFGLGVSPLSVVQESIIVRFFKDHGLGLSLALGLVVGKTSSFVAARTSYPLSEAFGRRAPFVAATTLAALSFVINLVYMCSSKWLIRSSGTELEASELHQEARMLRFESVSEAQALKQVAEKRSVRVREITKLGDVFWAYIGLNVLCGAIWSPFTHLAAHLLEKRYDLSEDVASSDASYLLAGSIILYPLCGYLVDLLRHKPILHQLFIISSVLTGLCYLWLALPPSLTRTPLPAVVTYAIGQGFAPLLLVVIVPALVSPHYIPTTLGAHKSLEQAGSTIFQTFAGLLLDGLKAKGPQTTERSEMELKSIQRLLNVFLFLNICQFFSILGLWELDRRRKQQAIKQILHGIRSISGTAHYEPADLLFCTDSGASGAHLKPDSGGRRAISTRADHLQGNCSLHWHPSPSSTNLTASDSSARSSSTRSSERSASGIGDELVECEQETEGGAETEGEDGGDERRGLLEDYASPPLSSLDFLTDEALSGEALTKAEHIRGEIFGVISICFIIFAWTFFLSTAFFRLRTRNDRLSG